MGQRKIRMRTLYANAQRSISPGQVAMVDEAEAEQLVDGGYAVYVRADGSDELPRRTAPGKSVQQPPKKNTPVKKAGGRKPANRAGDDDQDKSPKEAPTVDSGAVDGDADGPSSEGQEQ